MSFERTDPNAMENGVNDGGGLGFIEGAVANQQAVDHGAENQIEHLVHGW